MGGLRPWFVASVLLVSACGRIAFEPTDHVTDADVDPTQRPVVQTGTIVLENQLQKVTAPIMPVDLETSFLTYSMRVNVPGEDDFRIAGSLHADGIDFHREGTDADATIRWYVVSWPGMRVRHGQMTIPADTPGAQTAALDPPFDPAHSFVLGTVWGDGGPANTASFVRYELVGNNAVGASVETENGTDALIEWQIVEIPSATVAHGSALLGVGDFSIDVTPPALDHDRTFVVYSQSVAELANAHSDSVQTRGQLRDDNVLRFDRFAATTAQTISWFLVQLDAGRVQRGVIDMVVSLALSRFDFQPVNVNETFVHGGGYGGWAGSSNWSVDLNPGAGWGTLTLGTSSVTGERDVNAAEGSLPFQAIELVR